MSKIINFHDIADGAWFEDTINILKSKYIMIGIEDVEDFFYNKKVLKKACHITFDDGEISFYEIVYPILKKYNIPATIFVSPYICKERKNFWFQEIRGYNHHEMIKIIGELLDVEPNLLRTYSLNNILKCLKINQIWYIIETYQKKLDVKHKATQNITIEQLLEIDRQGLVKIGAHTLTHPILANEDDENCRREICDSFKGLEEILGHEIKYFAYPNGFPKFDFGRREINTLMENNCRIAFSCETKNFTLQNNPLSVNRLGFSHGSKFFVRIKLFLGEYWEFWKDTIKKGDISIRIELEKKILMKSKILHENISFPKSD